MFKKIKSVFLKAVNSRTIILFIVFCALAGILISRLFDLQIVSGEEYLDEFTNQVKKERMIKSTRGNIYDRYGNVLAYNQLSYTVTMEDNGTYNTTQLKNLTLNSTAYKLLNILESNGDSITSSFYIVINEDGKYEFSVEGVTLLRFKADIYGRTLVDDLKTEERNATAEEIMEQLMSSSSSGYGIYDKKYTSEDLQEYGLPESFTQEEVLKLVSIRYAVAMNSFQRYLPSTIATDVSDMTMAAIVEREDELIGVSVTEDSQRVYDESIYFSSLLGYTGAISGEELESLSEQNDEYTASDIVGKDGIEKIMETELQGTKGSEIVYVDNLGRELETYSYEESQAGNDVYLTISKELTIQVYKVLEQQVAGILLNNIVNQKKFEMDSDSVKKSEIRIPIYDVYFALIDNNVIDIGHLDAEDATDLEASVYDSFQARLNTVIDSLNTQLETDSPMNHQNLNEQTQEYFNYILTYLVEQKIISSDSDYSTDSKYKKYRQSNNEDVDMSFQELLRYAVNQNWIDTSGIDTEGYLDSEEIYQAVKDYILSQISTDKDFIKLVYKYMLQDDALAPSLLCRLLYDQGVLEEDDDTYQALASGSKSAYDFMMDKIKNLQITPAQLALEPCSASAVITSTEGEVLALVTYPGYDNNKLANKMDSEYYNKLLEDASTPFYNKATQQVTAPGSTYKPITAIAGYMEGAITIDSQINCTGIFDTIEPNLRCWTYPSSHGSLTLQDAITKSCNVYFSEVGYRLSLNNDVEDDSLGAATVAKYAAMFGLGETSGIETSETKPSISASQVVPSSIGQGEHSYATVQLAKYVNGLANQGTVYDLTLLSKVSDSEGETVEEYEPSIYNTMDLPEELWKSIQNGMIGVVTRHEAMKGETTLVAGKTGTAEESSDAPNHALFIGYAPYDNPEISVAVRIANGYNSTNAVYAARDIIDLYFQNVSEEEIITGVASENVTSESAED